MATYTSEELSAIANAPMLIGMAVAMADMGIVSSAIEAVALTKEIVGAGDILPHQSLRRYGVGILKPGKGCSRFPSWYYHP